MSRQLNPSQIWSQVPVASRTVEVNTKTGFSLTAGSYSVRASSTQAGGISLGGAASATATISAVTTARAQMVNLGATHTAVVAPTGEAGWLLITLTNTTTVTASRYATSVGATCGYQAMEFF